MSRYLRITTFSEPTDMGTDPQGRVMVGFNIMATKLASSTFVQELMKRLQDQGVGTIGADILGSSRVSIPSTGTVVVVTSTGGPGPIYTHNDGAAYRRPTAQVMVYADTFDDADAKAQAAFDALVGVTNLTLNP